MPDPTNVLDYNRYMYGLGNPVKFSDPSGHKYEPGAGLPTSSLAEYYRLDNGVVFDTKHILWSARRYRDIRTQVPNGSVEYVEKNEQVVKLTIEYDVSPDLTVEQIDSVTLAISMHFGQEYEKEQYGSSAWNPYDLQSNWVGYVWAANPKRSPLGLLRELNGGEFPEEMSEGWTLLSNFQNDKSNNMRYWSWWYGEYRHGTWPEQFQMHAAPEGTLWSVNSRISEDDRGFFRKQIRDQFGAIRDQIFGGE